VIVIVIWWEFNKNDKRNCNITQVNLISVCFRLTLYKAKKFIKDCFNKHLNTIKDCVISQIISNCSLKLYLKSDLFRSDRDLQPHCRGQNGGRDGMRLRLLHRPNGRPEELRDRRLARNQEEPGSLSSVQEGHAGRVW
jgi:hypothetical protein